MSIINVNAFLHKNVKYFCVLYIYIYYKCVVIGDGSEYIYPGVYIDVEPITTETITSSMVEDISSTKIKRTLIATDSNMETLNSDLLSEFICLSFTETVEDSNTRRI